MTDNILSKIVWLQGLLFTLFISKAIEGKVIYFLSSYLWNDLRAMCRVVWAPRIVSLKSENLESKLSESIDTENTVDNIYLILYRELLSVDWFMLMSLEMSNFIQTSIISNQNERNWLAIRNDKGKTMRGYGSFISY